MKIERFKVIDSTNRRAEEYRESGRDRIVIAARQTGGLGTKGRSFLSEKGGVYLTKLTFYRAFPAEEAFRILMQAAVAVCKTAESFGVSPEIKWANDVFVNGKKLCGILIENQIRDGFLDNSIVGIGLNVQNDVSSLGGIAISLSEAAGKKISVKAAEKRLICNLSRYYGMEDYLRYVRFLGREIRVTEGGRVYTATAREVLRDGRLKIEENGRTRILSAAEISISLP